jgi:hypothetical protein
MPSKILSAYKSRIKRKLKSAKKKIADLKSERELLKKYKRTHSKASLRKYRSMFKSADRKYYSALKNRQRYDRKMQKYEL